MPPMGIQDVVCVDHIAYPGTVKSRARLLIRTPTMGERISRMEADTDGGLPHRGHLSTILGRFGVENGRSAGLDEIKTQASTGFDE